MVLLLPNIYESSSVKSQELGQVPRPGSFAPLRTSYSPAIQSRLATLYTATGVPSGRFRGKAPGCRLARKLPGPRAKSAVVTQDCELRIAAPGIATHSIMGHGGPSFFVACELSRQPEMASNELGHRYNRVH